MDSKGPSDERQEVGFDPHHAAYSGGSREARLRQLEGVLLREVLQRLHQIHPEAPRAAEPADPPSTEEIETFAQLVIRPEPEAAHRFFNVMVERAYGFETLAERFAAPVARRLGEYWEEDRCDFLDVAFGVGRLREFLAEFTGHLQDGLGTRTPRALLMSTPGDTHVFGLDVLEGFLSEAGWTVAVQRGQELDANIRYVAQEWTHVVGVTMGSLDHFDAVGRTLRALRRASLNPQIAVVVGGALFNSDRELAVRLGADGTAPDGPSAVRLAKRLWLNQTPQAPLR